MRAEDRNQNKRQQKRRGFMLVWFLSEYAFAPLIWNLQKYL